MRPLPSRYTHPSYSLCQPRSGDEVCTWAPRLLSHTTPQWWPALCSYGSEQQKKTSQKKTNNVTHAKQQIWACISHAGMTIQHYSSLFVRPQALTNGETITFVLINIICGTPLELCLSSLLFFYNTKCRWEIVTWSHDGPSIILAVLV